MTTRQHENRWRVKETFRSGDPGGHDAAGGTALEEVKVSQHSPGVPAGSPLNRRSPVTPFRFVAASMMAKTRPWAGPVARNFPQAVDVDEWDDEDDPYDDEEEEDEDEFFPDDEEDEEDEDEEVDDDDFEFEEDLE